MMSSSEIFFTNFMQTRWGGVGGGYLWKLLLPQSPSLFGILDIHKMPCVLRWLAVTCQFLNLGLDSPVPSLVLRLLHVTGPPTLFHT